jgi:hypothetical protein
VSARFSARTAGKLHGDEKEPDHPQEISYTDPDRNKDGGWQGCSPEIPYNEEKKGCDHPGNGAEWAAEAAPECQDRRYESSQKDRAAPGDRGDAEDQNSQEREGHSDSCPGLASAGEDWIHGDHHEAEQEHEDEIHKGEAAQGGVWSGVGSKVQIEKDGEPVAAEEASDPKHAKDAHQESNKENRTGQGAQEKEPAGGASIVEMGGRFCGHPEPPEGTANHRGSPTTTYRQGRSEPPVEPALGNSAICQIIMMKASFF